MTAPVKAVDAFNRLIESFLSQFFSKVIISTKAKKIFIDRKGIALIYVIHGLHFFISFPFVLSVNAQMRFFVTSLVKIFIFLLYTPLLLKAIQLQLCKYNAIIKLIQTKGDTI